MLEQNKTRRRKDQGMKIRTIARASLLSAAIALAVTGCNSEPDMSQEDIQYISHVDQARFFQRQGELRASTQEARSAIELQPERTEPYFIILNNLLTAGDYVTTERQLDTFMQALPEQAKTKDLSNEASLIKAKANLMQGETDQALLALSELDSPDPVTGREAKLLKGQIFFADGRIDDAEKEFEEARATSDASVLPLIGLSKIAWSRNDASRAEAMIKEAKSIDPESPELWLWTAQLAQDQQKWQVAEEAYIRALDDIGQYDIMTHQKYQTIASLVRVLREQGKASEAFVYEEILAKSGPGTIKSNLSAAQQAFEKGDYNDAINYLKEVLTQAPATEPARLMLGMIRFRQGQFEEAEALLSPIANFGESDVAGRLVAASRLQMRDPEGAKAILANLENKDSDPSLIAMAGIASLATGDRETGEALVRKAIETAPENTSLRIRFARYLIENQRPLEAIPELSGVLQSEPDSVPARSLLVQAYLASNDRNSAINTSDKWVEEQPNNTDALMTRGNLAGKLGNTDEAIEFFQRAAKANPNDEKPHIALGRVYLSTENTQTAREHFTTAAAIAPDSFDALRGLAIALEPKELVRAVEQLSQNNPQATAPKLILLEYTLRNDEKTRSDDLTADLLETKEVNRPAPAAAFVAVVYNRVAGLKRESGELDRANELLERGRILFPENEDIAIHAASINFAQGSDQKAREILTEIKGFAPQSHRPYLLEANYLSQKDQVDQAAELYGLAIEKGAPVQATLDLIRLLQNSGRLERAIKTSEEAKTAYPRNESIAVVTAMLYQQEGRTQQAVSAYEYVLELAPNNSLALNNLAWLYYEQNDDRALELAQRAYQLSSDNPAIVDTYGWVMFNLGDQQRSVPILEEAHKLAPDSREIALHLADAYRATGQNAKAKEVLMKFSDQ
jgi:tetratricopeptide (TPR) repeat protein